MSIKKSSHIVNEYGASDELRLRVEIHANGSIFAKLESGRVPYNHHEFYLSNKLEELRGMLNLALVDIEREATRK